MKLYRILILTFFAYTLISCGGAEERKAVYLEKAKSSIEAGDLDKARIELKNVLQIDPKDSEAYYQLGKVYEQQKEFRKAYGNYLKAEELNPDNLGNKARLGRLYLLLANDLERTQKIIDFILSKDSVNPEGLLLKAAVLLKEGKKNEAINMGVDILKGDPGNVDAAIFVATMYVQDKKIQDATAILDTALQVKKDNNKLNNLLALIHVTNKDYERAEVIFKRFLEKYPDDSSSYDRLASLYNKAGNKAKAEKMLRLSIENNPEGAERYLTLVKYIQQIKGKDEAINEMKASVARNEGLAKLRIALAELYYINGDKESAIKEYIETINDFSEELTGVESRIALASIYLNERDLIKANEVVESALEISPNDPKINFLRAKLAVHNKEIEKAIISLRIVTKELPEKIEAYLLLANVYRLENNEEQVRSTLLRAHKNNKTNPEGLLALAKYYMTSDLEKTEKIIDDLNSIKEFTYEGLSIKAVILNQKKEQEEAYALAKQLIDLYPKEPNGYLQAIPYLNKQGEIDNAISTLEQGYLIVKDNRKILSLLTMLQISKKQYDVAEKRLKAELKSLPDDSELNLLLSKVYLINNKIESAEVLLKGVIETHPKIEKPYLWLSSLYYKQNNSGSAQAILEQGLNNDVSGYKIPLKLATLYEVNKEYLKAINLYRNMYKSYPDNLVVVNNLASMLSDHGEGKGDLELAKTLSLKLEKSGQPAFLDTIGWVYYKLGDSQKAVQYIKQVVEKAPDVNVFNYHLGMAYKLSGDKAQAKVYLEKSLADNKQFKQKELAEAALKGL